MPTATDEQRKLMQEWFGDGISDARPLAFLFAHGYTEQGGLIIPPVPHHMPTMEELECIYFLCDEWDYGWDSIKGYVCNLDAN